MVRSRRYETSLRGQGSLRGGAEALQEAYLHVSPSVPTLRRVTPALFGIAYRR